MQLTIRLLGTEVFHISTESETDEDDTARDLSGGDLGSMTLDVGDTDRYMGFSNGREVDD